MTTKCAKCGRMIWRRPVSTLPNGEEVYRWCHRRGLKPVPLFTCPRGNHHEPA